MGGCEYHSRQVVFCCVFGASTQRRGGARGLITSIHDAGSHQAASSKVTPQSPPLNTLVVFSSRHDGTGEGCE